MNKRAKRTIAYLAVILFVTVIAGLSFGSTRISPAKIIAALTGAEGYETVIVTKLRLPRVLGAVLSGIALPTAGLLLQCVTGNELTSPNIIGVNSGAGFAVMLVLCFCTSRQGILPFAAFAGALFATLTVMLIRESVAVHQKKLTIILAGVSVGAFFSSGISFLSQKYPDALGSYVYFSTGGFNGVYMNDLMIPAVIILICAAAAVRLAPMLNLFSLGDDMASSLGVKVKRLRIVCLVLSSAICAASVCYAGLLGFVGLIVPHISRKFAGHDMRILLPVGWLFGGILVICADLAGRMLFSPAEISAGVFLSAIGAPFFIYLLYTRRDRL